MQSAGYSTNPSDSVNLRSNSSAERAAASGPLSGSASVSPSALANISATSDAAREREEPSVGGVDSVDAALFDAFDYVALGHLHSPQKVGRETLRYCGTPLKYSISEAGQR